MKKLLFLLLFILIISSVSVASQTPKVALVLSGGIIPRGFCEIGVIKALEEENIPLTCVAGTSMGAVLGSLLAQGYTADEIAETAKSIDWVQAFLQTNDYKNLLFGEKEKYAKYLLRLELDGIKPIIPSSLVNGQKPSVLFSEISIKALNITDFNAFKIPFRANATDLETGQEVDFSSGDLPKVLQAASAVPMMMQPVEIDNRLLVDGGVVNNLPVNLVEEFKPDLIIAVNVKSEMRKKQDLNSLFSVLSQSLSFLQKDSAEKHKKEAAILIEPDIKRFSVADFGKIDQIVDAGYQAAKQKMPAIKQLLIAKGWKGKAIVENSVRNQKIIDVYVNGITVYPKEIIANLLSSESGSDYSQITAENDRRLIEEKYFFDGYKLARVGVSYEGSSGKLRFTIDEGKISAVSFIGNNNLSQVFLKDKVRAKGIFNSQVVEDDIDRLYSTGYFESVNFKVIPAGDEHVLQYLLKEKYHNSLGIGMRYDSYQQLALLGDLNLHLSHVQNFNQTISLKIGNEYDYQLISQFWPQRFGQNLLGEFGLFYFYKSQDLYTGSQLDSTFHYLTWGARLGAKLNLEPLGQFNAGIETSKVTYEKIFSLLPDENIVKAFLKTRLDLLDDPLFPKTGALVDFQYYQGITSLNGEYDFSKTMLDVDSYYLLPWQHVLFEKAKIYLAKGNVPISERYRLGGEDNLIGYGRGQFIGKDMLALRLGYRLPLSTASNAVVEGLYLSLFQDIGIAVQTPADINSSAFNTGYGAELQFNTMLGLASRLNFGFGQKPALFLSIGNEF